MKIPTAQEIEKFMRRSSFRPLRIREILKRLHIPKEGRGVLKKTIEKMVQDGRLMRVSGGRYVLPERLDRVYKNNASYSIDKELIGKKIIGKFVRIGKSGFLVPRNLKIPRILVRGNEFKGIRKDSLLIAEFRDGVGTDRSSNINIIEVLGRAGRLEVEYRGLLEGYGLDQGFPKEVLHESKRVPLEVTPKDLERRKDLRHLDIFTIDNDRAMDFDDAVGISRVDSGYKLWVSIADVSHYVKLGSNTDNEALKRGTSVYLPDRVIPMLPERFSNKICSLVPNEDRLTKTVEIDFNARGSMTEYRIYDSVIHSRARLTYTWASDVLNSKAIVRTGDSHVVYSLYIMKELYEKIRERRIESGELSLDIPEPELVRDELGRIIDVIKLHRNIAHGIIEEFMIAANTAAALRLIDFDVPSIYRIHDPPDIESLVDLDQELKKLGFKLKLNGKCRAKDIQSLIKQFNDRPEKVIVHSLVLKSLKRAVYSTMKRGHFGLALRHYTHFTSPIRRYPDLVIHRLVDSVTKNRKVPYSLDTLDWISNHSSQRERFADEVERESIKLEGSNLMKSYIGDEFEAIIVSILPFGVFVQLKDIYVEGLIPRERIRKSKKGWIDVGQLVKVKLVEADVEKRRITFDLVS